MLFTIERIRTIVLATAVLLVVAIGVFLGVARFRHRFISRDIPGRLGINIQQEANGVTYTQAHGGHTIFKIHASRVVQLRNSHATLHDVVIELYGKDGARVDRIQGAEFEYDQKTSIATAAGMVEIEMERPTTAAPLPGNEPQKTNPASGRATDKPLSKGSDSIRVKASGVTFNQSTGILTTLQRVEFTTGQGSGSALGASYDSDLGFLVLNSNVELNTSRGNESIAIHAAHAEFNRDTQICNLRQATAQSRGEQASATEAHINFRRDGTVENLKATSGFNISTSQGGHISAPTGNLDFAANNQPHHARLEGGVTIQSASAGRTLRSTSPIMDLDFTPTGDLRHAHLERGVEMQSEEQTENAANAATAQLLRTWHSSVADIDFSNPGRGQIELASMHGAEGVVLTSATRRPGAAPAPARLAADDLTAQFGPGSTLNSMTGIGHASLDQTAATGAHQTAAGDRIEAQFNPAPQSREKQPQPVATSQLSSQLQTAQVDGHVVLINQPAAKSGSQNQEPMRATAGHALYETSNAAGAPDQLLHLTINPRVTDGGIDLTADKIDIAQTSGDAFAHGNVKATWSHEKSSGEKSSSSANPAIGLGGTAPAHVVAADAQLHQATGEATFRGHARLWQDQNSISAPVIVLNRQQQTLTAQAAGAAEPVLAVMLSAEAPAHSSSASAPRTSSVIRVRSGDLRYSAPDRIAILHAAPFASVTAQTGAAQSASDQLELYLMAPVPQPTGVPSPPQARVTDHDAQPVPSQIDRIIAQGHVILTAQGRRGTGQQLTYTAQTGNYVLTGTPSAPPRMTDPARGTVTGESLLFNSRDDSVSIEGGSQPTTTQSTAPR